MGRRGNWKSASARPSGGTAGTGTAAGRDTTDNGRDTTDSARRSGERGDDTTRARSGDDQSTRTAGNRGGSSNSRRAGDAASRSTMSGSANRGTGDGPKGRRARRSLFASNSAAGDTDGSDAPSNQTADTSTPDGD
jgi:hypothetical protein